MAKPRRMEDGRTSCDESEREPVGVVREDGPLIGLHNIDSITGEFFAALRASSMLARRSTGTGEKEREKTKTGKERDKGW